MYRTRCWLRYFLHADGDLFEPRSQESGFPGRRRFSGAAGFFPLTLDRTAFPPAPEHTVAQGELLLPHRPPAAALASRFKRQPICPPVTPSSRPSPGLLFHFLQAPIISVAGWGRLPCRRGAPRLAATAAFGVGERGATAAPAGLGATSLLLKPSEHPGNALVLVLFPRASRQSCRRKQRSRCSGPGEKVLYRADAGGCARTDIY